MKVRSSWKDSESERWNESSYPAVQCLFTFLQYINCLIYCSKIFVHFSAVQYILIILKSVFSISFSVLSSLKFNDGEKTLLDVGIQITFLFTKCLVTWHRVLQMIVNRNITKHSYGVNPNRKFGTSEKIFF